MGGYSASELTNLAAAFLQRYSSIPRGRIVVPGLWSDIDLCAVGSDSRLNGTLLSIHMYTLGGESHPTETGWINSFKGRLCGHADRAILTEFGVPMNTGVNYNGPRDGNNNVSYLYALTDTVRELGMGSLVWTGVKEANQTQGPGPCFVDHWLRHRSLPRRTRGDRAVPDRSVRSGQLRHRLGRPQFGRCPRCSLRARRHGARCDDRGGSPETPNPIRRPAHRLTSPQPVGGHRDHLGGPDR